MEFPHLTAFLLNPPIQNIICLPHLPRGGHQGSYPVKSDDWQLYPSLDLARPQLLWQQVSAHYIVPL